MTALQVKKELKKHSSLKREKTNEWFFKTGPGEYGEGDKFMGVNNPDNRATAKKFKDLSQTELQKLIRSKIHEERLCALLILVSQYKQEPKKTLRFYLKNLKYVNNWDLVDLSAHYILGQAILDGIQNEKILDKLVASKVLWERRVGIIATMIFIRYNKFGPSLRLSKKLLGDEEDLMHKAVGWVLREIWKKDSQKAEKFLKTNYKKLPRTTLRYAIERMPETKRKRFLKGEFI